MLAARSMRVAATASLIVLAARGAEATPGGPLPSQKDRAHSEASPEPVRKTASRAVYDLSLSLGPLFARSTARYQPTDVPGPLSVDEHEKGTWGLALTGFAGRALNTSVVGGAALVLGAWGAPDPFTGDVEVAPFVQLGPQILLQERGGGLYGLARITVGSVADPGGPAWGGAMGFGYAEGGEGPGYLAVGLEATALASLSTEQGDFGYYRYERTWLGLMFVVRFGSY